MKLRKIIEGWPNKKQIAKNNKTTPPKKRMIRKSTGVKLKNIYNLIDNL